MPVHARCAPAVPVLQIVRVTMIPLLKRKARVILVIAILIVVALVVAIVLVTVLVMI